MAVKKKSEAPSKKIEKTEKSQKCRYWLMKSEPDVFSIFDLEKAKNKTTHWDGVRNYQARNFLRDEIKLKDKVLYYHSNSEPSAIVGVAEVVREGYPDHTAFDENDDHYDPKSKKDEPTWYMVDIKHVETFAEPLPLSMLKEVPSLKNMVLLQKGSRLSVQPVTEEEFEAILKLSQKRK
ncbi:MAG: EVE domain protein [bacterium ADurb.Bin425]|jgi:predicted RNA-binding protein with PUA-like domain|nr:MAG: EVE domain protein [bacterium ADurb.Bin425]